jgi:FtsZ-interacting cell division protein YlmF
MGFMTGVLRMLGAAEDEHEYDEQIVEYPSGERYAGKDARAAGRSATGGGARAAENDSNILTMPGGDSGATMCIYRPTMQAAGQPGFSMRSYAGELLARKAIIVDVNELASEDLDEATRVVDYLSGVAEAVAGSIYEIAKNIFIFAPSNVSLGGDQLKQVDVY